MLVRNSGDATKWSLESDGSVRVVGCEDPSAAVLARARVCAAAGREEMLRLNVGSTGEGEWRGYGE
eukprot:1443350-Pleurochrysis_carterae.AAC.2